MSAERSTLIGDGIEHPGNVRAMFDAAAMFGATAVFCDPGGRLAGRGDSAEGPPLPRLAPEAFDRYAPLIALENLPGAASVYGYRLPDGPRPALAAGNERRGVSAAVRERAAAAIEIPLASRRLNTLNVAAASAVALYYLNRGGGGRQRVRASPAVRRPDVLFCGPTDHVELGSAIRSAAAFGWQRLLIDDRRGVWFGGERARMAEGRAAARRHRNPIRLIPTSPEDSFAYRYVTVLATRREGTPLHRVNLTRGASQLLVMADGTACERERAGWARAGAHVEIAHLDLAAEPRACRFRLIATVALAEASRQIGRIAPGGVPPRWRERPF